MSSLRAGSSLFLLLSFEDCVYASLLDFQPAGKKDQMHSLSFFQILQTLPGGTWEGERLIDAHLLALGGFPKWFLWKKQIWQSNPVSPFPHSVMETLPEKSSSEHYLVSHLLPCGPQIPECTSQLPKKAQNKGWLGKGCL